MLRSRLPTSLAYAGETSSAAVALTKAPRCGLHPTTRSVAIVSTPARSVNPSGGRALQKQKVVTEEGDLLAGPVHGRGGPEGELGGAVEDGRPAAPPARGGQREAQLL